MSTHAHQATDPGANSKFLYWFCLISLIILSVLIVTLPLTVPIFIYVYNARKRQQAITSQLQSEQKLARQNQVELQQFRESLKEVSSENGHLRETITRIDDMDLLQRQEEAMRLDDEITAKQAEIASLLDNQAAELTALKELKETEIRAFESRKSAILADITSHRQKLSGLEHKVVDLEEMVNLNDYGLYNFENPATDSVRYGEELKANKVKIKEMVKNKTATSASMTWTVNGSSAQGRKMVNDMSKLLLRAFNAEAENSVKTVRAGHLSTAIKRLDRSAAAVARLGKMMDLSITPRYVSLREEELRITHAHLEAKKAAKELEREERAREREERQAQKELAAAKAKQLKEVEHYRTVLETLQSSSDAEAIATASANLEAAEDKLSDVESTMANTKAGYVYVISNRGAFGSGIIKIGMTRRLNPQERVRELGDASVPFYFDTHTMIFARDAVGLERALHRHFAAKRVNLINLRREYFYATPSEVKEALVKLHADYEAQLLEFHEPSDAPEYIASEDLRHKGTIPQPAGLAHVT